jgi:DNA-directed RNA polymerase subunit RPC12/RpoP
MAIDIASVRLYTCCNCGRQWTNWDGVNRREGRTPVNCPSCKTVRWNQNYIDEERVLIDRLSDEHLIKKDAQIEKVRLWYGSHEMREVRYSYFDFIAYDFLYMMIPSPDLFELKQVNEIPLSSNDNNNELERRHDLMLSMIKDRIDNKDEYEKERFSKYGKYVYKNKWYCDINAETKKREYRHGMKHAPMKRLIMDGCNHEDKEEVRKALIEIYYRGDRYPYDREIPEPAMHVKDYEASLLLLQKQKERQQTNETESNNDNDSNGQPPIITCGECNEKVRLTPQLEHHTE